MAGNEMTGTILEIVCLGLSTFIQDEEKETHGERFLILLQCVGGRMIVLLLSITVAMTGNRGENDFSFPSDALLWRTLACRLLLAGSVSLACNACASRRVSHNMFAYVFVCARACERICHPWCLRRGTYRNSVVLL